MSNETKLCPFCGKEIKAIAIKCKHCGKFLNSDSINTKNSNNYIFIIIVLILILAIIFTTIYAIKQNNVAKENNSQEQIEQNLIQESATKIKQQNKIYENKKLSYREILEQLEKYQTQYWRIVKKNDVLLYQGVDYSKTDKDAADLSSLFETVENNVDKNNQHYKKLKSIENQFENNTEDTHVDRREFVNNYNQTTENLLNAIYKEIELKIPNADFNNLKLSEQKWIKDTEKYINSIDTSEGNIWDTMIPNIECNIKRFRILLLLLYYN